MYGLRYLGPLRNLLRVFSAERSPHQISLALALGMVIGIMPKGNLLACLATLLLFALRVNLGVGLTTTFLISCCGDRLDGLTHGVGVRMLQMPGIYTTLSRLYELPLVPWTSLNNTVVAGSLLLGGLLFYPVYHLSRSLIERLLPVVGRVTRRPSLEVHEAKLE